MPAARLSSLEALVKFREAWCQFLATAKESIVSMDGDIRSGRSAVEDNLAEWRKLVVLLERKVADARIELNRKKLGRIHGRPVDTTVDEEAVRKAIRRHQEAEAKIASAKKWIPRLDRGVLDYQGPRQQLMVQVDTDLARGTAFLDHKIEMIELYSGTAPVEVT